MNRSDKKEKRISTLIILLSLGFAVILNTSCTVKRQIRIPAEELEKTEYTEAGLASWYGAKFHGLKTASGETYDMYAMTAAHKTLPFGTIVNVRNPETGKEVLVRINDRGPFIRGRIIDLSYSAAKVIGIDITGTAKIELQINEKEKIPKDELFALQVGAFSVKENAENLKSYLSGKHSDKFFFIDAEETDKGKIYRVKIGYFDTLQQAQIFSLVLDMTSFIITVN